MVQTFQEIIAKDIVTLLRERQLVNSVMDKAGFQQIAGIATGITTINEALDMTV